MSFLTMFVWPALTDLPWMFYTHSRQYIWMISYPLFLTLIFSNLENHCLSLQLLARNFSCCYFAGMLQKNLVRLHFLHACYFFFFFLWLSQCKAKVISYWTSHPSAEEEQRLVSLLWESASYPEPLNSSPSPCVTSAHILSLLKPTVCNSFPLLWISYSVCPSHSQLSSRFPFTFTFSFRSFVVMFQTRRPSS